jgi:hypothetical protein
LSIQKAKEDLKNSGGLQDLAQSKINQTKEMMDRNNFN